MKIPQVEFTLKNLKAVKQENEWSDHFNVILWPRILIWLGLAEHFKHQTELEWRLHYTPNNMHSNMISAHIKDPKNTFNFYFQIPLKQRLQFNLYLGDSTYNFFEIHPFLNFKGIIEENAPRIEATSTILPHLVLSDENNRYSQDIIRNINEENFVELTKNDPTINLLVKQFEKFIPPLKKIINGEWQL